MELINQKDAIRYSATYGTLLLAWVPMMTAFQNDVVTTALAGFFLFVIVDKIAAKLA